MINLVVVSHGGLAEGLFDALSLIIGKQEGIAAVALREGDSIDELLDRIRGAVESVDQGDGVLVFVDLIGASPFNVSARLTQERANVQVVAGVNLPMLLEVALQREGIELEQAVRLAKEAGQGGVKSLDDFIRQFGSEE